jgi:hypothetical protein
LKAGRGLERASQLEAAFNPLPDITMKRERTDRWTLNKKDLEICGRIRAAPGAFAPMVAAFHEGLKNNFDTACVVYRQLYRAAEFGTCQDAHGLRARHDQLPNATTCRWFVETRELWGEQMPRKIQMIGKKIPTFSKMMGASTQT